MKEYYCKRKGCYYHGLDSICPEHNTRNSLVREPQYDRPKPEHDVYTLREINGPPMGGKKLLPSNPIKFAGYTVSLDSTGQIKEIDMSSPTEDKDIWWKVPMPHHIIWKDGIKLSIYQGVKP